MKNLILCIASFTLLLLTNCSRYGKKINYTFVVAGDVRLKPSDTSDDPSTANVFQLKRLFREVSELKPLPKFLIFNGDLVFGYTDDTVRLANELKAWIDIYKASPLAKTDVKLITLPGNHEVCVKIGSGKISLAANERVFVRIMKNYINGDNGPKATGLIPGTDSLMSDQSRLTYSFDYGGDHFVIFNTDPVDRESRVPYHWLEKDLAKAHKDGVRHIFAFSHKPPYPSYFDSEPSLIVHQSNRDSMWHCLEKYKCKVMFCSHYHLWDSVEPDKGKTWEVIAGNAGAPVEKTWLPCYYGYTLVKVSSGKIDITSFGNNFDKDYPTLPTAEYPTMIRAHFTIEQ